MSEEQKQYRDEGALRIMEALSGVDEELLERCGTVDSAVADSLATSTQNKKVTEMSDYRKKRKLIWTYGRICAACLCLVIVGVVSWNSLRLGGGGTADGSFSEGAAGNLNGAMQQRDTTEGTAQDSARTGEAGAMPEAEENQDFMPESNFVGNADNGGSMSTDMEQEKERLEDIEVQSDECAVSLNPYREITEEEAREYMPLGAYIPTQLPSGYQFESARVSEEEQWLTLTWTRGMDYLHISVGLTDAENVETVDVGRPELYDEHLYEIPYGETVPAEFRETFFNPVFAAEDLSLEIVSSRLRSYNDSGDTDTPRGNFDILYPDGILLSFNGRGTPEEVWNMFTDL